MLPAPGHAGMKYDSRAVLGSFPGPREVHGRNAGVCADESGKNGSAVRAEAIEKAITPRKGVAD